MPGGCPQWCGAGPTERLALPSLGGRELPWSVPTGSEMLGGGSLLFLCLPRLPLVLPGSTRLKPTFLGFLLRETNLKFKMALEVTHRHLQEEGAMAAFDGGCPSLLGALLGQLTGEQSLAGAGSAAAGGFLALPRGTGKHEARQRLGRARPPVGSALLRAVPSLAGPLL